MKKNVKIVSLILAAAILMGCAIGGTLAWLTDKAETVVNTFTAGNIDITLTETDYDGDNNALSNDFEIVPGREIAKNPTLTIEAGSEAAWIFVCVRVSESLTQFIDLSTPWENVSNPITGGEGPVKTYNHTDGDKTYVYLFKQDASDTDVTYSLLVGDKITVRDTVTKAMVDELNESSETLELSFTVYALQYEGFENPTSMIVNHFGRMFVENNSDIVLNP